ncbi:MAG: 16S rRNA (cytidine(1402)-2'-O)-methyltransferase [Actinomycetia bacterium]|nr:16S rRNA (cytidine(1402)-2'-O)-methyltransferase [Actinomycetes bacterium]MCP4085230.1 16S rRNA (cytidine(1402)-2'-O)-methyltransferase [Actinomycetes bacterium]
MSATARPAGELVLVATPIGNLGDLSPRAIEAFERSDLVGCEDTRRTGGLLHKLGIKRPMIVVNEHTEFDHESRIVAAVASGQTVVLVSDAGTPAVSDPGARLVQAVVAAGLAVSAVPGPSAVLAALVVSGLPTERFTFEGFLPRKGAQRVRRLAELVGEARTMVFYEAPHRLHKTLTDLADAMGASRPVAVARELTKLHEDVWRGELGDAVEAFPQDRVRGEFVLVVGGQPPPPGEVDDDELTAAVAAEREAGSSTRDAVALVAQRYGVARNRVYRLAT